MSENRNFSSGLGQSLFSEKRKMPRWVFAVWAAEAVLVAILAFFVATPVRIPYPTSSDEDVLAEKTAQALIAQADSYANNPGSTRAELLAFYEAALEKVSGTIWASEIRRRVKEVNEKYEKDAQEALARLNLSFVTFVALEDYGQAQTELDNFTAQFADCAACAERVAAMRARLILLVDAKKECSEIIEKANNLWRSERASEALQLLSSFSAKYPDTVYAAHAKTKKEEIESYLTQVAAQRETDEKSRQEQDTEGEEEKRLREEAQQRWIEEQMKQAQEESKKAEEEKRRAEEEARAKETPKAPQEEGEQWTVVEMKQFSQKEFPFITPFPTDSSLVTGPMATTTLKFLPLPNEGRKFGHGVEDRKNSIEVDADADGVFETHLPGQGGIVTVKVFYAEEGEAPYTVKIFREDSTIHFRRHCFAAGKFGNTKLFLIDEDSNGKFNDYGTDALATGENPCACTLANVMMIGGKLYEVKASQSGKKLSLRPFATKTGKLDLVSGFKSKGNLLYAIVTGKVQDKKGNELTAAFNLAGQAKGLEIPVGTYDFHAAAVGSTSKLTARITKSRECKQISVAESSSVKIDWGAPGRLDFSYNISSEGKLSISPNSIQIYGAYGEVYSNLSFDELVPNVQVKDENGTLIFSGSFEWNTQNDALEVFECSVPRNAKLKVRILGKIRYLGDVSSDWK